MTPQTVSLEIAKQLKEAGWKKRCFFAYSKQQYVYAQNEDYQETSYDPSNLQAPQMHEILEELPEKIDTPKIEVRMEITNKGRHAKYQRYNKKTGEKDGCFYAVNDSNPHNNCALLWLWCVKEGYITLN